MVLGKPRPPGTWAAGGQPRTLVLGLSNSSLRVVGPPGFWQGREGAVIEFGSF